MAISVTKNENGKFKFSGKAYRIVEEKNKALAPYNKCIRCYGLRLELLPTEKQMSDINQQIGNARFIGNHYLQTRIDVYEKERKSLGVEEYKKNYLASLKKELPFLKKSDKFALEEAIKNVDAAYKNFFEGRGRFPKFSSSRKPRGNKYSTCYTNGNLDMLYDEAGRPVVKLPKVGHVRFILPFGRTIASLLPNDTVSQTRILGACVSRVGKRYFVSFQLEGIVDLIDTKKTIRTKDVIAMDVGLKSFCVYGNHEFKRTIDNPKWIKKHEKRLRRFQQSLSRKQYDTKTHRGSKNWEKARLRVLKEQQKIANQRKDFHHKLSREIANMCTVFLCEDLNIKGMIKNRHLSKAIQSVGWGQFLSMVKYKMEAKGGTFQKISRWFPSSKLCSCGYKYNDLTLGERYWICPECHKINNRDENAVDNIEKEGIRILTSEFGYQFIV